MKYFIFFLVVSSILTTKAYAATPTATTSAAKQVNSRVDDLKERLATKVAQLRQTSPKAISGTVTAVSVSSITVEVDSKAMKIELTDEIKVAEFIKGKRTELTTEDIAKNDKVTIFGQYDSTIDVLEAESIFIEPATQSVRIHGTIASIDKKTNSITVKGVDEQTYTVDIETTTKTTTWTTEKGLEKSGFSRLTVGQFVSVLGTPDKNTETTLTGLRILHVTIPGTLSPTPSLSPTKQASPSATLSPTKKTTPKPTATETPEP